MIPQAYSVKSKNKTILKQSSSGGVFFWIAHHFINELKGIVYGARFYNNSVTIERATSIIEVKAFMKSKYIESNTGTSFIDCASDLKAGKHVFFVGLPCQITALVSFLKYKHIDRTKLLTADLFCHGTPQTKYWKAYVDEIFPNETITNIDFRYKKPNCDSYFLKITTNKRVITEPHLSNLYFKAFLRNYTLKPSCYRCNFKGENRYSDLTIGDFWGSKKWYPEINCFNGLSLIIVRNKDSQIIDILEKKCSIHKVSYYRSHIIDNTSYFCSSEKPNDYIIFEKTFKNNGFLAAASLIPEFGIQQKEPFLNHIKRLMHIRDKYQARKIKKQSIGIITEPGFYNFGNRLQNYALRYVLNGFGYKSYDIIQSRVEKTNFLKVLIKHIGIKKIKADREHLIREASYKSGQIDYKYHFSKKDKKEIRKLKAIILGSDQIWNWTYHGYERLMFQLGDLGTDTLNVFSYAASFGIDYIRDNLKEFYKNYFNHLKGIGLREQEGVHMVEKLGFNCVNNLDPTLLLSPSQWNESITNFSKIKVPHKRYCLVYVLNPEFNYKTLNIEEEIINVLDKKSEYYNINHFDFINLIKNSSLVITDSFHALVFSYIFEKNIKVIPRDGMNSRINSLFSLMKNQATFNKIIKLNHSENIENMRNDSLEYINNYINN